MLNYVVGETHTFSDGFEFIVNPKVHQFVWTTDGYMDKPEARQLFKSKLAHGLTYKSVSTMLYPMGFEEPLVTHEGGSPDFHTCLDWRDEVMACK